MSDLSICGISSLGAFFAINIDTVLAAVFFYGGINSNINSVLKVAERCGIFILSSL